MSVFGAVFARGGSKGVKGKNLREVGGVSLVQRAVTVGVATQGIDRMICSTDSEEIAAQAKRAGAEVPFLRPSKLAEDTSPEWGAWQHLSDFLVAEGASESDLLVSLPATAPLRSLEDVDNALEFFRSEKFDLVLGVSESDHSPWFNVVRREVGGRTLRAIEPNQSSIARRQDAPQVFNVTTSVYVTTLGFIDRAAGIFDGSVGSVLIPPERAIDIDTELDLQIANFLATHQLGINNE